MDTNKLTIINKSTAPMSIAVDLVTQYMHKAFPSNTETIDGYKVSELIKDALYQVEKI